MDQAQSRNNSENQNPQKLLCKQPITCPWITTQPYPSTLNKNRSCDSATTKSMPNIPLSMESKSVNEKTCPSLQHSSSQFFYFLRLMQLFPETHPATLHTVLCLCKNDFFCAVDKLLYAKRCKSLYSRSQGMFKRCSIGRSHPYCGYGGAGKMMPQQEKMKSSETFENFNGKEFDLHKDSDVAKAQDVEERDEINAITGDESHLPTTAAITSSSSSPSVINNQNNEEAHDVTSLGNSIQEREICDRAPEA